MNTKRGKSHFTQWTGQFAVAAELSRRGYLVSLTLGNTPATDLFCQHMNGGPAFGLQVKSLATNTFFPVSKLEDGQLDDLFALVYIPARESQPLEFYIAKRSELIKVMHEYVPTRRKIPKGVEHAPFSTGVTYRALKIQAAAFKDQWDKLPKGISE